MQKLRLLLKKKDIVKQKEALKEIKRALENH